MQQTSSQYFRTIRILQLALVAGQVVFAGISLLLTKDGRLTANTELIPIFNIIVPVLVAAGIAGSMVLFRTKVNQAKMEPELTAKMAGYRGALVLKYAMLEGPSLFAVIAYLLTGQLLYLAAPVILIILTLMQRPDKDTAIKELELDYNEQAKLDTPDDLIADYKTDFD